MPITWKNHNNPLGESNKDEYRVNFSSNIKVCFQGTQLSSNGGLLLYRDLDESLGMTEKIAKHLIDHRTGKNIRHSLLGLLRQSIYSRLSGYEDINDAEVTMHDPSFRYAIGGAATEKAAASASEMQTFETRCLTKKDNVKALHNALGDSIMQTHTKRRSFDNLIWTARLAKLMGSKKAWFITVTSKLLAITRCFASITLVI